MKIFRSNTIPILVLGLLLLVLPTSRAQALCGSRCLVEGQPDGCDFSILFEQCENLFLNCNTIDCVNSPVGEVERKPAVQCASAQLAQTPDRIRQLRVLRVTRMTART
jgi:hypothetical protein